MGRKRITKLELESESYAKLYKFLFIPEFKGMSNDAKVLYTLLRDRYCLSSKNEWVNDKGEVFLIYTREEMCEILERSDGTTGKAIKQLKKFKLIESERQGLNKPNRIYIMNVTIENTRTRIFYDSRTTKNDYQDQQNMTTSKTDLSNTDSNKTNTYIRIADAYSFSNTSKLFYDRYLERFGTQPRMTYKTRMNNPMFDGIEDDFLLEILDNLFTKNEDNRTLEYLELIIDRYR